MTARFTPHPMSDAFAKAEAFLAGGKAKTERLVGSNTRLRWVDADTIALVYHYTAVVTYHRDGTFTLYGGGWNTVTTKRRIRLYSPSNPRSDGKGGWIVGCTGEVTAPRVQKCRACRGEGGEVRAEHCYERYDGNGRYRCVHGSRSHPTGQWRAHACYRCGGEGVFDYGSRPVPILASASQPYRVDASGVFLGYTDAITTGGTHASWKPAAPVGHNIGGGLVNALERVLPNVRANVLHPLNGVQMPLNEIVVNLNDTHRWTRERIADWLETLDVDLRFPVS